MRTPAREVQLDELAEQIRQHGLPMGCSICGREPCSELGIRWQPRAAAVLHRGFTAAEIDELARLSGFTGERGPGGNPVIAAPLIRRRRLLRLAGRPMLLWYDTDEPFFCCPWNAAPPERRAILGHGYQWVCEDGTASLFARQPDGGYALEPKNSACPQANVIDPGAGGVWLKPVDIGLPRRQLDNEGRFVKVVDGESFTPRSVTIIGREGRQ